MKSIFAFAALFFSLSAYAIEPANCPRVIDLEMDSIEARVHTGFARDADYKAAVEALNTMSRAHITYSLVERKAKSCEYTADRGSSMDGRATLYTRGVHDPEEPGPVQVDTFRPTFWVSGIRARFGLFLTVEAYGPASLQIYSTNLRGRTLMALLTEDGQPGYRRSGKVTLNVTGSR